MVSQMRIYWVKGIKRHISDSWDKVPITILNGYIYLYFYDVSITACFNI